MQVKNAIVIVCAVSDMNSIHIYYVCTIWNTDVGCALNRSLLILVWTQRVCKAVYRIFAKGGRTWSMSKRGGGGARLFVAAGQPQGGGCIWKFKGGQE